ncbi:MAG TPA: MarR family transcriptional regulator [Mucilaginibacter sp.]|nr:MarR family transcriptional regulator [Mucilaginibacter sp.]
MNFGEDLSLQVMLANKSYNNYLFKVLKEIDVYQHYQIILLLSRSGGRTTQKFICENLQIEKSNIVSIIDLLEKKNYVTREVNFKDRRGKLIGITPKASYIIEMLDNLFSLFEEEISNEISWQEMHNCLRVLQKVNDKLKDLSNFIPEKAAEFAATTHQTGNKSRVADFLK